MSPFHCHIFAMNEVATHRQQMGIATMDSQSCGTPEIPPATMKIIDGSIVSELESTMRPRKSWTETSHTTSHFRVPAQIKDKQLTQSQEAALRITRDSCVAKSNSRPSRRPGFMRSQEDARRRATMVGLFFLPSQTSHRLPKPRKPRAPNTATERFLPALDEMEVVQQSRRRWFEVRHRHDGSWEFDGVILACDEVSP